MSDATQQLDEPGEPVAGGVNASATTPPSKYLIVQFAARALRRVHLDWQLFGLGYVGRGEEDVRNINVGLGAEAALETAVAAAFAQEFNASKLAHGWLDPDGQKRFYFADREVGFRDHRKDPTPGARPSVDLMIRRVDVLGGEGEFGILPIELKRARLWIPDMSSGQPKRYESAQIGRVADDIKKLKGFAELWIDDGFTVEHCDYVRFRRTKTVFPHVLVWGVHDLASASEDDASPNTFLKEAFSQAKATMGDSVVEWLPMAWDKASGGSPPYV